ncbi:MAG: hypothetical protein ACPGYV_05805 [Phycisphaeraceae bacterium]
MMTIRSSAGRVLCLLSAFCFAVLAIMPASADSLQREGFPTIDNVTLIGVEDGKLKFRTAAGDREAALEELVSISITSVPEFNAGLAAFKDDKLRAAQRSFEDVYAGTRIDWIKHFAGYYLTQVYDKRNQAVDAAQIYSQLAASKADLYFLSKPPIASLAEADENQKQRIGEQIMAVIRDATGEHRTLLRAYHRRVVGDDADLPPIDEVAPSKDPTDQIKAKSKLFLPEPVWKMLSRRGEPEGKWQAITLLSQGDAKASLEAIKPWLSNPGDLPEKLFTRGKAQLLLAEAENDPDLYRDAALSFMRIVIHFNRAGQAHSLVVPAKLEVAYIHQKIGRDDIYQRLLEEVFLVIDDAEAYPQYRKRYYEIIGEEVPEDDQP